MGHPTIYPTGVTVYNKEKAWSGYTIFPALGLGALLVDMNGNEVKLWKGLVGFPNKILPGGYVLGSTGERNPKFGLQDMVDLVQVNWDGEIVWKFDGTEYIEDPGDAPRWMARQHHDYQREGNPVGYYAPALEPQVDKGKTLILTHENLHNDAISGELLLDDKIIDVDWNGNITWEWRPSDHFEELGFDDAAKEILYKDPNLRPNGGGMGDWLHINSASYVGANHWYDDGDSRFHPDNIIWDSREANITAIVDRQSGDIVWRLGPNFDNTPEEKELGWIVGLHHAHIIPKGLPGEGNLLLFDNGGWAGYGEPNPMSPTGRQNVRRDYSRILEINPITLAIVWQYTPQEAGFFHPLDSSRFYSPFVSSAQRLPNGNTLITEGSDGRIFEVTKEYEIVWEFINPYKGDRFLKMNMVYRAYRVPYEWIPQLEKPVEESIVKLDIQSFRVPGAGVLGPKDVTELKGVKQTVPHEEKDFCVIADASGVKKE